MFNPRLCLTASALALALVFAATASSAQRPTAEASMATGAPQFAQLDHPLSAATAERISAAGIRILHHYGEGRYLLSARLPGAQPFDTASLALAKTRSARAFDHIPALSADQPREGTGTQARPSANTYHVELVLAFPGAEAHLRDVLAKAAFEADEAQVQSGVSLRGTVDADGLRQLLAHPYLLDASPILEETVPYSDFPLWEHRATVLNNSSPGGLNLNGEGVVIGIGDGGRLSGHPDVAGRVVYSTGYYNPAWGTHPDFVSSLAAGAGTLNPRYRGTASKAKLVIEGSSSIVFFGPYHYEDYGMTITNNSYGPPFDCESANRYWGSSASVDEQLRKHTKLTHVYAAGNSGRGSCNEAGAPYASIPGGSQCAKNTLTVGNATSLRQRFESSSCGPTFDGRLKPEVIAVGHGVLGNDRSNSYSWGTGTSLSAPAVVGMLALFTEHYKHLHGDSLPDGALLKAVTCNTADEMGRPGPDFENGFGMISGTGGIRALSQNAHVQRSVDIGQTFRHALAVAPGTEELKVLLYWHDRPGATQNTAPTLVDDLDLYLLGPAGDTLRPWVLDALRPAALAVRGRDSVNNIEQVTIATPAAGTYTLVVTGRRQPFGKTDFVVTWSALRPHVEIVQPVGGESFDPGAGIPIAWECSPGQAGHWQIEYAEVGLQSGQSGKAPAQRGAWKVMYASLEPSYRSINWVPPTAHNRYVLRVTNLGTGLSHEIAAPVTALATPTALKAEDVCAGQMRLSWQAVPDAVGYEVLAFDGKEMALVDTVAQPEALIANLTAGSQSFFSVRSVDAAGNKSVRAVALASTPATGGKNCGSPLPVQWASLGASDLPLAVRVAWGILQELNTDYFEVQRSTRDGGGGDWVAVGTVRARGYADAPTTYTFDDEAVADGTRYYYRVRQYDLSGEFADSEIVTHLRPAPAVAGQVLAVAQNPVGVELSVRYNGETSGELEIYDIAGRRLGGLPVAPGINHLPWPGALPTGLYVLRIADGSEVQTVRIVKS